jgi:multidrug efflux system membrane fusion protein
MPVTVAVAVQKAVPVEVRTFGTVEPGSTATVKAQINGLVTAVHFKEGQDVRKGDLLFSIDPRPAEAALKQTEANLARDRVQLRNATSEAFRQTELLKKGFAAQDACDQAQTAAEALAAAVKADEAVLENARTQLEYCRVVAPIDGRTGSYAIEPGSLAKANETTLVTIHQISPARVSFAVPQREFPAIMRQLAQGKLAVCATIPGAENRQATGELTFVDNAMDEAVGTVRLKGTFANEDRALWPGQFVNVTLTLSVQPDAVVVPSQAVQSGQRGAYVYVVKPDLTVEHRAVVPDRTIDGETVIARGISLGEQVVTDGQLRLAPGTAVTIKSPSQKARATGP